MLLQRCLDDSDNDDDIDANNNHGDHDQEDDQDHDRDGHHYHDGTDAYDKNINHENEEDNPRKKPTETHRK